MAKLAAILIATLAVSCWAYDHEYETYKAHHARLYRSVTKDESWKNFNAQYTKQYRSEREAAARKTIFLRNLNAIQENHEKFEQGLVKHFLGVTEFADMDHQEFKNKMAKGMSLDESLNGVNEDVVIGGLSDPPPTWDWNSQGKVTPVKNQGNCGSCWAFATNGVLEAQALINEKGTLDLSEQYLVDCFDKACDGADPRKALIWLEPQEGSLSEASYPYDSTTSNFGVAGTCQTAGSPVLKSYRMGQLSGPMQDNDLKNYLMTRGPLAIALEAGPWPGPGVYKGGVLEFPVKGPSDPSWTKEQKDALGLHAVLLVGWNQDPESGQDYWIIKNSWGESWGNAGFGKVGIGSDRDSGVNSYYAAYAPVVPNTNDTTACRAAQETCATNEEPNCCTGTHNVGVNPDLSFFCICK